MGWLVALIILLVVAAAPFVLERRRTGPSRKAIAEATGRFAQLSDGRTYYQWHGPKDGNVLVAIHGLSTPSYVWDGMIRSLTMMGFRVLTYDLYGRGLSDCPRGAQSRSFFVRQLRELLDDQGVDGEFSLMGFSMGGVIASIMAAEQAERVERLILIAPAGFDYAPKGLELFMRDRPILGDWLNLVLGARMQRAALAGVAGAATAVPDLAARQRAQIRQRGYLPSILSSRRHILRETLDEEMHELKRIYVPVLAVWGGADRTIPSSSIGKLAQLDRDARQATVAGATHWLPITHPREVMAHIQEFMRET